MAVSLLRIYSTAMWRKYTTPISKEIVAYAVGVSQMAVPVFAFFAFLIPALLGAEFVWTLTMFAPFALYVLHLVLSFKVTVKLDLVLKYELSKYGSGAKEIADGIRLYVDRSAVVTIAATVAWASALLAAHSGGII